MLVRLSWHFWGTQSHTKLCSLGLSSFLSSLQQWYLSFKYKNCTVDRSVWFGLHNVSFWLTVVFCNVLHLFCFHFLDILLVWWGVSQSIEEGLYLKGKRGATWWIAEALKRHPTRSRDFTMDPQFSNVAMYFVRVCHVVSANSTPEHLMEAYLWAGNWEERKWEVGQPSE